MMRLLLPFAWLVAQAALVHAAAPPPDLLARAGVVQRLGEQLPTRVRFIDASGRLASLARWMDGKPSVLMLGYFRCPNLCDAVRQAMAHALDRSGLHPGVDVSVIFLSIDPHESTADAAQAQRQLMHTSDGADVGAWHFLTGDDASIHLVANAIGYRYDYDPALKQYVHPAGAVIVDANGVVGQYLMGLDFVPRTVRLSVVAASHHTTGSIVDQLVLLCCGYDPTTGRYTLTIVRLMQWLGLAFLACLLILLAWLRVVRGSTPR